MLALALPVIEDAAGGAAEGSVSYRHDPMDAIEEALHDGDFHEIILSTLPHSVSRWLHSTCPTGSRISGVPVTTVVARERLNRRGARSQPAHDAGLTGPGAFPFSEPCCLIAVGLAGCGGSKHGAAPTTSVLPRSTSPRPRRRTTTRPAPERSRPRRTPRRRATSPTTRCSSSFATAARGYSIKYPEGWAQQRLGRDASSSATRTTSSGSSSAAAPRRPTASVREDIAEPARRPCRSRPPQAMTISRPTGDQGRLHHRERTEPVTGKRVKLIVDRYYLWHAAVAPSSISAHRGRRQRRRLPADDRELPVELRSLYREPERHASRSRSARSSSTTSSRSTAPARPRRSRCAGSTCGSSRARWSPLRPVGLGQEHGPRIWRPGSTCRRPATSASSGARSRGSTRPSSPPTGPARSRSSSRAGTSGRR